ncbi:UNKNOWN [Stylonychia lemnae]|uniref:Uncharacterized protein n=1 Tax=Stylonychia lemnae TaxID=5949 RepID=A0A078A0X9_STYLE|nr:UNKNOWN [Stylonychia lemnae]|eukprot:CDW75846.1 UNKNOWN [Stylonychia lemnae]
MLVLSEMINTRILEESVSQSPFKKHIITKYVDANKQNSILASRTKLDSMRFNYQFGVKDIDHNLALKAFMTKNIERRMFRKTPLNHEIEVLTQMVKDKQQQNLRDQSIEDIEDQIIANPDSFLKEISPQFTIMEKISNQLTRFRNKQIFEGKQMDTEQEMSKKSRIGQNNLYNENNKARKFNQDDKFLHQQSLRYPYIKKYLEKEQLKIQESRFNSQKRFMETQSIMNSRNQIGLINHSIDNTSRQAEGNRLKLNQTIIDKINEESSIILNQSSYDFDSQFTQSGPRIINLTESIRNLTNSHREELFSQDLKSTISRAHKQINAQSSRAKSHMNQYNTQKAMFQTQFPEVKNIQSQLIPIITNKIQAKDPISEHIRTIVNQGYDKQLNQLLAFSKTKFQNMKSKMDDINLQASNAGETPGAANMLIY